MECLVCHEEIPEGQPCYEIRYGYLDQGEFFPESDLVYAHQDCLPTEIGD